MNISEINIQIIRSARRTLALEVRRDGSVVVRAPYLMRRSVIDSFVESKRSWIAKHVAKMLERMEQDELYGGLQRVGEEVDGVKTRAGAGDRAADGAEGVKAGSDGVKAGAAGADEADGVKAGAEDRAGGDGRAKGLSYKGLEVLREEAQRDLTARVAHWSAVMGITYNRVAIRFQKSRWGSCSSKGNINLNAVLMFCPEVVRDYVVIHELAHRREMNHSQRFWAIVEKYCPSYGTCRKYLRDNGARIMSQL